jgi:carboxyl-terminal processing protease
VVALAWFTPSLSAQSPVLSADLNTPTAAEKPERLEDIRRQAREAEKRGDWLKACWRYDEILRRDRTNVEAREAYHRCLRHHQITTRHNDRGYRDLLAGLVPSQALDVYEQVLHALRPRFVERDKADYGTLFKHGLTELRYALEDEVFVREHLSDVSPSVIQEFRAQLKKSPDRRLSTTLEAREQVNAVLKAGYRIGIPDRPALTVVVALEFASGACSGLDEYTFFFDPSSFGDLVASSRIKYAGVGADLVSIDGQIYISRVQEKSPANEARLVEGTLIRRIDGMEVANLPAYYVAERLRGEVGSTVELVVVGLDQMETPVRLVRRPVGTVDWSIVEEKMNEMPMPTDIGYLRITNFQESTAQEVREALAQLQTSGIKALILDLRGNPGGLFKSAVKVSELFLPEGSLVVLTQGTVKDFDQPFRATGMNPFALPMVVLVDGETASAAEVLAGGLKEQGRARLIGQTTFGKGSIQQFILLDKSPLQKTPGGIRITVAKFFWPGRSPDGGRGIVPHDVVGPDTRTLIEAATRHLRAVTGMMMMPRQ